MLIAYCQALLLTGFAFARFCFYQVLFLSPGIQGEEADDASLSVFAGIGSAALSRGRLFNYRERDCRSFCCL